MTFYNENIGNRLLELLNYPVPERCGELQVIFERCSMRELQETFPALVQSVFGLSGSALGWSLRATTRENAPHCFEILRDFFSPVGPMLRLCYRLLNDAVKFEISLDLLPVKVREMLRSGHYSMFYSDLLSVDPFQRQVSSLSLNAFDYYILHFVLHATFPLHKMYPSALQVHNERMKTVYFFLTYDYLCNFLPGNPDGLVYPLNVCPTAKAPQPMPVQTLQAPKRSPKYIKIPSSSLYAGNNIATIATGQVINNGESPRAQSWRTESVLHFFVDIWLRYDIDETRDLPSSEFLRVVRILVKQTHSFANSAWFDQTSMTTLRKIAQPLMKTHMHHLLKSIISRWPLDSSLAIVLELWLSYIQPWRYTFEQQQRDSHVDIPMGTRFDCFIVDNLAIYTQIFLHILPRFERLDFSSLRNVMMLNRLVKVFSQPGLAKKLQHAELTCVSPSYNLHSPQRNTSNSSNKRNTSSGGSEWDTFYGDDVYTPLFGKAVQKEIEGFMKTIAISRTYVQNEISSMRRDIFERRKSFGFFKRMVQRVFEDVTPAELHLQEIAGIPELLELVIRALGVMFNVTMPDFSGEQIQPRLPSYSEVNFSQYENSDCLDITKLSPFQMMNNLANVSAAIDPAVLPLQGHECKWLVRFFHGISTKINEMFGEEMEECWNRTDFFGKLTRQVLYPPMTVQWFDKPKGVREMCENELPARLILRPLASYKVLGLLLSALIAGYLVWNSFTVGLLALFLLFVFYLLTLALIS